MGSSGLNGIGAWASIGSRTDATALLLGPADEIRFLPNPGYNGTPTFTFRAWDQTIGAPGENADTSSPGGTSAFSTASDTASVSVNYGEETTVGLDASNNLLIQDVNGGISDDALSISVNGTSIRVSDPNLRLLAVGAGVSQVDIHTVDVPIANITGPSGIIVDALDGDDTIEITSLPAGFDGDVTVNDGAGTDDVSFNGNSTLASNRSFDVTADSVSVKCGTCDQRNRFRISNCRR